MPLTLVSSISHTFLVRVLLSIIVVGPNVLAAASDKRAEATDEDADAVLHTAAAIPKHLEAHDAQIAQILSLLGLPRTA